MAYQDGPQREHKEQSWGRGGRDGGGFARDFVTSGRCFIDLNPLTGGTLRGYSPIVFTARDALEISSSRPPPPLPGRGIYLPTGLYEFTACRKGVINSARYWSRRCAIRFAEATRRGKPIGSPRRLYFRYCHRRLAGSITYNIFYTQVVI